MRATTIFWNVFVVIWLAIAFGAVAHADDIDDFVEMRGFKIDFTRATQRDRKSVFESLDRQLQIVEDANVPDGVMEFFRGVPIMVDPALQHMNGAYVRLFDSGQRATGVHRVSRGALRSAQVPLTRRRTFAACAHASCDVDDDADQR